MDHIPGGEIASQLPMFIDPTMIVDSVLAGSWDAADALGNSPYVSVTPRCNPSSGVGHRHPTDVVRNFLYSVKAPGAEQPGLRAAPPAPRPQPGQPVGVRSSRAPAPDRARRRPCPIRAQRPGRHGCSRRLAGGSAAPDRHHQPAAQAADDALATSLCPKLTVRVRFPSRATGDVDLTSNG
jgi:hypothetical protein